MDRMEPSPKDHGMNVVDTTAVVLAMAHMETAQAADSLGH